MENDDNSMLYGDFAAATFSLIDRLFTDLLPITKKARIFSLSDSPILIESGAGLEPEMLAQSIHNHSNRKSKPFIILSISGMTEQQQENLLFGNIRLGHRGAILDANMGTLMIQGIDKLTLPLQSRLAMVIRSKRIQVGSDMSKYKHVDIRIIATTSKNLTDLRQHFLFRSDLLFTLKALRLRIPPLRERPNDIMNMLDFYLDEYNKRYRLHHSISEAARKTILQYSWQGNVAQLQSFCERMILTAENRVISAEYIKGLIHELYIEDSGIFDLKEKNFEVKNGREEKTLNSSSKEKPSDFFIGGSDYDTNNPSPNDPYKNLIVEILKKNHGSRKLSARELNVSTTTLWRKIKKYNIEI